MSEWTCPICGQRDCEYEMVKDAYGYYKCKTYNFQFFLSEDIIVEPDNERLQRILNLITEHMLRSRFCTVNGGKRPWYFYDALPGTVNRKPEYINVANLLMNYPEQVMEKANRSLRNISLIFPHYGDSIYLLCTQKRAIFEHEDNNFHVPGMMLLLEDLGYLKDPTNSANYFITATGWQKIDELYRNEKAIRQGFIAMSFQDETKPIRNAFKQAMTELGYMAAVIDEKEHNNQIVPEIFYEIARSKFVVVDVTYPNYGAYYEAGYAQALGKQVIICCREDVFRSSNKDGRPHFDISQKSMVVWSNEDDLVRKLKRRIEATVN